VRARQTNESKCNRPEYSDGLSDTHSGRVSAARGGRDEDSTFARHGFLVLKVTETGLTAVCMAPREHDGVLIGLGLVAAIAPVS
jgi:hypothetical protein